jgi:hypothetical protein
MLWRNDNPLFDPLHDRAPARIQMSMLALTDSQLGLIMTAAGGLSPEKRALLLERVAARLRLRGTNPTEWQR